MLGRTQNVLNLQNIISLSVILLQIQQKFTLLYLEKLKHYSCSYDKIKSVISIFIYLNHNATNLFNIAIIKKKTFLQFIWVLVIWCHLLFVEQTNHNCKMLKKNCHSCSTSQTKHFCLPYLAKIRFKSFSSFSKYKLFIINQLVQINF